VCVVTTIAEPLTTGRIAARIDRLPLTWTQWRFALITQLFWGIIVAVDGTPAKLYPFVWGPRHDFGLTAFSLLLAVGNGAGIIIGEYLISLASDRFGRRTAMLASSLIVSLLLWPTALTDDHALLMLFFFLSSFGIGGIISTSVVYMGELVSPRQRGRIMLASQIYHLSSGLTFAVILVSTMLGGGIGLAFSSWLGERVERRKTVLVCTLVNAAALWAFFFVHSIVLSFVLITISWGAAQTLIFNLYNYSAASYPTRLRTTGVGMTDGLGHLGAIFGPIVVGALYAATAMVGYVGWFAISRPSAP
jgi:MFS family permease